MNGKKAKAVRLYAKFREVDHPDITRIDSRSHYRRLKWLARAGKLFTGPVREILHWHHVINH